MVERICEILLKRWNNFTAKWRLKYYREKYKHLHNNSVGIYEQNNRGESPSPHTLAQKDD